MAGCCGNRATTIFAALYGIILSLVMIAISVYALLAYSCSFQNDIQFVPATLGPYIFFIAYLYSPDCGTLNLDSIDATWVDYVTVPEVNPVADETFRWTLVYIVYNCVWCVCSIILLINGCACKSLGGYVLWIVMTAAGLIIDVVATIVYALQIQETESAVQFLRYIGFTVETKYENNINDSFGDGNLLTTLPAIGMTLLFSKVGIFWIINLIACICVTLVAFDIRRSRKKKKNQARSREMSTEEFARVAALSGIPSAPIEREPSMLEMSTRSSTDRQSIYPPVPVRPVDTKKADRHEDVDMYDAVYLHTDDIPTPPPQRGEKNSLYVQRNSMSPPEYLNFDEHGGHSGVVPGLVHSYENQDNRHPDDLQKKLMASNEGGLEQPKQPRLLTRLSGEKHELRSQLPWSYLNLGQPVVPNTRPISRINEESHEDPPVYDGQFTVTKPPDYSP